MAGALALASTAGAASIKVTNTSGFGPGSLRSAIKSANHLPGFDQIVIRAIEVRRDDLIDVGDGRFVACTCMVGEARTMRLTRGPSPSFTASATA